MLQLFLSFLKTVCHVYITSHKTNKNGKNQSFYQQQFTKREKSKEERKKLTFLCIVMPLSRLYTCKVTNDANTLHFIHTLF